jgi:hypothetical protein
VRGWKKNYKGNDPPKQAGIAIVRQNKRHTYIGQMRQRRTFHINKRGNISTGITIINLYAPNVRVHNFIKYTLRDLKEHIDSNMVVMGDFSNLLSPIDRL